MTKQERIKNVLNILEKKFGHPKCALNHRSAFELLVATILSAQCTDIRVNIITESLFKKYNTPEHFAKMPLEKLETLIKSAGFYKNKSKSIKLCSQTLLEKYNGEVPQDMNELIELAGVGRKTANVVRGEIWGLADGVTVDTHVKRLSNLIGFFSEDNVEKIEQSLMKIIPKNKWIVFSHYLILHGRDKCKARNPNCIQCEINKFCKHGEKILEKFENNS
ncbi:MAG: endonuclease III [Fusobacteriaceae bacterium]